MTTLLTSILPAPIHSIEEEHEAFRRKEASSVQKASAKPKVAIPPYGQRKGFVPRSVDDFGDGGSFPEIHVAQFPLDLGRPKHTLDKGVVPVSVDADGRVKHEAILGHKAGAMVVSQYTDLVEKRPGGAELERPSQEDLEETTSKTRAALEALVSGKIAAAQPAAASTKTQEPTYIKYTPAGQQGAYNSGASTRIIRMVEMPKDPLEPSKFRHKKAPRGPPSPPVPVMHSPPRKVTMKDQQMWKIPPCISNWKNSKGYTIPLDKRLASDAHGLQDNQINDAFAKLSQSLYVAERVAREDVAARSQIQKQILMKEKDRKEETLRKLAEQARSKRTGADRDEPEEEVEDFADPERHERDKIRDERKRERERDLRMEAAGKKTKISRDQDRDVTEKIALGQGGAGAQSEEAMYDQRLFNQSQGMDSGFGSEDSYNIYSKPLFAGSSANVMYRPKKNADEDTAGDQMEGLLDTAKFKPDRDFSGVDRSKPTQARSKPVEFEKNPEEQDPFGLDAFLDTAKKGAANKKLEVGGRGHMAAASGGGREDLSSRKNIDFERDSGRSGSSRSSRR